MKRIISAAAILAIVGGALAFRTAGQSATIYCFQSSNLPNTGLSCTNASQPSSQLVDFVVNSQGHITNPCSGVSGSPVPYVTAPTTCTSAAGSNFSAPGL
jgi:hypothetical protein